MKAKQTVLRAREKVLLKTISEFEANMVSQAEAREFSWFYGMRPTHSEILY